MNKNILSHIGLALVSYGALIIYIIFVLLTNQGIGEIFGSGLFGVAGFFGYFATFMLMFGWILIIPALIISIMGLVKKDNVYVNAATSAFCAIWIISGYWVILNFR